MAEANVTFVAALLRRFSCWAIWLPQQGQWTAVRVRYGMRPMPHATLIWVQAASASKLCADLERIERELETEAKKRTRKRVGTVGPS